MSEKEYLVTTYEPLQVSLCLGSGLRAIFRNDDGSKHTSPVAAVAVCRVRRDWYRNGRRVSSDGVERQICGVLSYPDEGFSICEDVSNFLGYLQPGEELEEK
jgi:hypothetical protein